MKNPRCIATASDANYFPGLLALLNSLKKTNPQIPVTVLDGGLTREQVQSISRHAEIVRKNPFIELENKGKFAYLGNTTLLKFEVSELDYEQVLYLDADMVVLENLDILFGVPEGKVGVVSEVNALKNMFRVQHRELVRNKINAEWNMPGFNAGLFCLRTEEHRDLKDRALSLIGMFGEEVFSKTKCQQILNLIFSGKTYNFPRRYNFSPFYDNEKEHPPAIIHYLTECKPWHTDYPEGHFYQAFRDNISETDYPDITKIDLEREKYIKK